MRPQHVNSLMPRWTAGCTRAVSSHDPARASRPRPRALAPEERQLARERESEGDLPPVRAGREGAPRHRPPARAALRPVSHGALELQAGAPAGAPRGRGAAHPREIPRQDPRHRREERQGAVVGWGRRRRVPRGEARSAARACACAYVCVCASLAPSERRGRRAVASGGFTRVHDPDLGARRPPEPARRPQSPSAGVSSSFLGATHPHAVPRALLSGRAADTGWLVGREGWVRRPAGASPAAKHEGVNLRTKERHETKLLVLGLRHAPRPPCGPLALAGPLPDSALAATHAFRHTPRRMPLRAASGPGEARGRGRARSVGVPFFFRWSTRSLRCPAVHPSAESPHHAASTSNVTYDDQP